MAATISGSGTSTLIDLTTSGNTILGDASTDTLNVGNGGLVKDASGNVGIGTSTFNYSSSGRGLIEVNGSSNALIALKVGNTANGYMYATGTDMILWAEGTRNISVGTASSGSVVFQTNNAERMRIDSSGNLLVGTTSTINSGKAVIDFQGGGRGLAIIAPSAGGGAQAVHFYAGGTQVGNIAVTTTTTSYGTSSDYRLKHDIAPMTGALAKVALLKPVTYKWNADDSAGEGFIAHELQEVCPSAVTGEKDAVDAEGNPQYQGIDTSFLVATLTAAIQELKAIVDAQAVEIAALKGTA